MKYSFIEKKDSARSNIKLSIELCTLMFVICALSLLIYFAKAPKTVETEMEENDIVSVFEETDAYYFFDFDEIEKTSEGVYEFYNKTERKIS